MAIEGIRSNSSEATVPFTRGAEEDFNALLSTNRAKILSFILSQIGVKSDAEDVLQKVSLTLWRKFPDFQTGSDFLAWSIAVASLEVKNFRRTQGRSKILFDDDLVEQLAIEHKSREPTNQGQLEALEHCLQKLSSSNRSLIQAIYSNGETVKSLAARESKPLQTYYNRLNLIRRMLADCLQRSKLH